MRYYGYKNNSSKNYSFISNRYLIVFLFIFLFTIFLLIKNFNQFIYQSNYIYIDFSEKTSNNNKFRLVLEELKKNKCDCQIDSVRLETIQKYEENKVSTSCDLTSMMQRGFHQKVLSVSINNLTSFKDLDSFSETFSKYLPDWLIRVYHENKWASNEERCNLVCNVQKRHANVDFCPIDTLNMKNSSFFWKWLPIGDSFVDYFISIDFKNVVIERIVHEINAWMKQEKSFFVVRGKKIFEKYI